jgi:2,3-dihydroxyphenylpropionate 1,2-dioxygenase
VERFDPELVVVIGPDHVRAFRAVVPAFAVITTAEGYGDWGGSTGSYVVDTAVAFDIADQASEHGLDVAVAEHSRLDHGFGQIFAALFDRLDAIPAVPIFVNCLSRPLMPMNRVIQLGAAIGETVDSLNRRVLILASGGLSHAPPTLGADFVRLSDAERERVSAASMADAAKRISPEWDAKFLSAVADTDLAVLSGWSNEDLNSGGPGAHEVRTWVAACSAAHTGLRCLAYEAVPEWITGMAVAVGGKEASDV